MIRKVSIRVENCHQQNKIVTLQKDNDSFSLKYYII